MIMGERQLQEQLTLFQPCHCEKGIFCPGVEYDDQGYMKYHPCYHQNLGKRFTEEEKEYLCKYASDGMNSMGMALARPPKALAAKLTRIRQAGKFHYYKNLSRYW